MKKLSLLLMMTIFCIGFVSAQRTVTGTITDDTGEPLIGATVQVKDFADTGAATDIDGTYSIDVPDGGTTLVISYIGFSNQEITLGAESVYNVTLSEGLDLDEVVITSLGIKREKKALGYGVATVGASQLADRSESDVARILRGKATGVDITSTSGMVGSGTNIIIRGYTSISGTNQPLFVVDGVPFATEGNSDRGFAAGGSTSSSRFLDLDPNNIAEISILKGLSATVLYGEAGRNGVVLVTTKNNDIDLSKDKGFEISVSQSLSQTEVANVPDYQNTFGNGFSGDFGWFFSNWGPSFDTRGSNGIAADGTIDHPLDQSQYNDDFPEFIGVRYPYQPYTGVEDFFQKGNTSNTSVSVQKNLGNGAAISATYSYLDDQGFTPLLDEQRGGGASNFLKKHNFGLGAKAELANGLTINGTFNYVQSSSRIPPAGPGFGGDGNGLFAALLFTPRSIDLNNLPYQSPLDGSNVYYRRGGAIQNPYWTLNNAADNETIQRFYSSTTLSYKLTDWLNVSYRLGFNQYTEKDVRSVNRGGPRDFNGRLETSETLFRTVDQVLNFVYNKPLNDDLTLDGVVGVNFKEEKGEYDGLFSSNQFVFGFLNHGNFIDHNGFSGESIENTIGIYATATLGYKNFLYLNLQGRNDWTSTLEEENRTFFYPSASLSFVASDAIPALQNNRVVDFLKVRVGFGTSAGYPNPYSTRTTLGSATNTFVTPGGSVLNTNTVSNFLGNPNLRPEKHEELEFGLEARFFKNRFGIDLSVFDKKSSDLIINQNLDPATGSTNTTTNAAQLSTSGVELALDFVPVRTKNLTWDFTLNYTKVVSEVDKIADGVNQIQIAGFGGGLGNWAIPGESYGVIQGQPFQRNDAGVLLVGGDGNYVPGAGIDVIGDPNPNFSANWINNLSWKGLSFGFQWSYTDGGDIYSSTVQALLGRGNTVDTDVDRFLPIAQPGVLASDGETPANIQGYIGDLFFRSYFFAAEGGIFDGTVIRLREISLSYTLPTEVLKNTPFGSVGITFAGENLFYNAPNFPEGINFDPEVLSVGVGNGRGFDFRTGPTAKKIGVTLNATF